MCNNRLTNLNIWFIAWSIYLSSGLTTTVLGFSAGVLIIGWFDGALVDTASVWTYGVSMAPVGIADIIKVRDEPAKMTLYLKRNWDCFFTNSLWLLCLLLLWKSWKRKWHHKCAWFPRQCVQKNVFFKIRSVFQLSAFRSCSFKNSALDHSLPRGAKHGHEVENLVPKLIAYIRGSKGALGTSPLPSVEILFFSWFFRQKNSKQ